MGKLGLPIMDIVELVISDNEDGQEAIALVDKPAIQRNFVAFADESFNDYPEGVKNAAQRALDWADKNGWGSCGTPVGKTRANQLAKGESISFDTVQRMYSYLSRHKVDLETSKSYEDGCGKLMYDSWGGEAGLSWSERIVNKYAFKIENEDQRIVSGALLLADTPIYRKSGDREFYVMFSKDTIKKIAIKYFKEGKHNNVNEMHNPKKALKGITLFESWISDAERGIKPMVGFEDVPDGSWFGSMKIDDDATWENVKQGKFKGFSIEGYFSNKAEELRDISDEQLVDEILNILEDGEK